MIIEDGNITLSTGKELSANLGIIGLAPKGKDGWEISEGYDAGMWSEWYEAKTSNGKDLTKHELIEIADYMIALWGEFKMDMSMSTREGKSIRTALEAACERVQTELFQIDRHRFSTHFSEVKDAIMGG